MKTQVQPSPVAGKLTDLGSSGRVLRSLTITALLAFAALGTFASSAGAAGGEVGWLVHGISDPTVVSGDHPGACIPKEVEAEEVKCDRYQLLVLNAGSEESEGTIVLKDELPAGLTFLGPPSSAHGAVEEEEWSCSTGEEGGRAVATCELEEHITAGHYAPALEIKVSPPSPSMVGPLVDDASVEGGGSLGVGTTSVETQISAQTPGFEVSEFTFEPGGVGGGPFSQAGGHPWEQTVNLGVPLVFTPQGGRAAGDHLYQPVQYIKSSVVESPLGFLGDPLAAEECTEAELINETSRHVPKCPPGSRVGTFATSSGHEVSGRFEFAEQGPLGQVEESSAVYNMVPQAGFPAVFGFDYAEHPILIYAGVVHTPGGYRVRVASPSIPSVTGVANISLTLFGEPGVMPQLPGVPVSGSTTAFLSDPSDCSAGVLNARVELESWDNPGHPVSKETVAYPALSECNLLQFAPSPGVSLSVEPSPPGAGATQEGSTQVDTPSAYSVDLKVPQTSGFTEVATPPLRDATVTLPAGVSVSPSAATGLLACQSEGAEGINIGSSDVGPGGQDLGDPDATELGAGHPGGNGSQYDDGLWHTAPGHCPEASKIGTVEVCTPSLANRANSEGHKEEGEKACEEGTGIAPLQGKVYLAQPNCAAEGQPASTCEAAAEEGKVFGLYLEVEGSGVIAKLKGTVEVGGAGTYSKEHGLQPGQVRTTFDENPQLPFNELKLHLHGGPRAPLANPQTCGTFTTTSVLEPWSSPTTPDATPSSEPFSIASCENKFVPSFNAGTTNNQAGAYTPFTLTFGRHDGEQDLSGVTVNMPRGLIGKIAGITQCGEAEANAGTCPASSRVGTATAAAGSGSQPFYQSGNVYLTGPYKSPVTGAEGPFGLSVVVAANAGPYHLGNIVTRASISINPQTAAVTVVSNPLPRSVDGIPLRLQSVNVTVGEANNFTLNPTSCSASAVNATLTSTQGGSSAVSSPFQPANCNSLGFAPQFSASTQGQASKANGASLTVKVGYPKGSYANIAKVDVSLPKALPSRLTTLQKACTEAQFAANPAGCPSASAVGMATATTPLLNSALTGPAYLVSRGGAAFPDLVLLLQGEGVTIELVGNTDIKNGITYSKFETVPDAPVSSFELNLPQGPYSILGTNLPAGANYSLCGQKLVMPTEITGQNGAVIKQNTPIAVTGACAASLASKPSVKITKVKVKGNTVVATVTTSQKGTVTVTGKGLKSVKKTLAAGTHQLKLALTKTGKTARKHHRKVTLKAGIKSSTGSASATKTLEL
jgi:hypothetical protein